MEKENKFIYDTYLKEVKECENKIININQKITAIRELSQKQFKAEKATNFIEVTKKLNQAISATEEIRKKLRVKKNILKYKYSEKGIINIYNLADLKKACLVASTIQIVKDITIDVSKETILNLIELKSINFNYEHHFMSYGYKYYKKSDYSFYIKVKAVLAFGVLIVTFLKDEEEIKLSE